jgi:polysaccharide biosynthesis transport protein
MTEPIEAYEEQESNKFQIGRYLDLIKRRHMHFLIPLLVGWIVLWAASWILPAKYKSGTLILVEEPTMPKNYVEPNVTEDLQSRLQSITQQILSRTRLLLIINKLHLYEDGKTSVNSDAKVELMRNDINIELVRDSQNSQITAFKVYYTAGDPRIAQQVTGELTNLFINENLKSRQEQSQGTTAFMQSQLENARTVLADQEAKIRDFQGKHEGELPSQQASNLQILSGLQEQLQAEQNSLNNANQQKVYLQSLIEQYKTLRETTRTADGTQMSLPAIDQEIEKLKAQRMYLTAHYTERHPDVLALSKEIAKKEKQRSELLADSRNKETARKNAASEAESAGVADVTKNASLLQLQSQLRANASEIANRTDNINKLKGKINLYQTRLDSQPAREQELADLTRGYDQSKANYDELLKKKNDSVMATSMEQMQQGQRFSMIDPPSLPTKPDSPKRMKLCGIGLGFGIALGIIVAGAFEFFDDRIQNEDDIKALLPVAIISEIPEITNTTQEEKSKRRLLLGWAMTCFVVVSIMAGSMFSYLHQ